MGFSSTLVLQLLLLISLFHFSSAGRKLNELVQEQPMSLKYHNGPLLYGKISVNLIWYGKFKPSQRAIITDFFDSLYSFKPQNEASVSTWWKTTEKYYKLTSSKKPTSLTLTLNKQILDEKYSLGKSLTSKKIVQLAAKGEQKNAINVVLTASDVVVDGFCSSRCGTHGSSSSSSLIKNKKHNKFAYIWVGNSETQCPGQCAWPFHQPIYGPQSAPLVAPNNDVGLDGMVINLARWNGETQCPGQCAWPFHQPIYGPQSAPLVAPNNDVGLDGMVINLASLLAGTATNPFGNGYYQGEADAPLEVASACPGIYGKGAYPGYAGELLVDPSSGASFNAHGGNGRKYLLPALFDPSTSSCSTLV